VTGRQILAPGGGVLGVEVGYSSAAGAELRCLGWQYPEPATASERQRAAVSAEVRRPDLVAAYARLVLLPGLPAFLDGIDEMFAEGHALRDVRMVQPETGDIRTVRLYGWLPARSADIDARELRPVGISIDISELSGAPDPSTRFFEALVSVVPDTVMVIDLPSGQLVWSNGQLANWLSGGRDRLSSYRQFRGIVHPADRAELDALADRLRSDPAAGSVEVRFRLQDEFSAWRWVQVWIAPWRSGPSGQVEQIVCMLRDVDTAVRNERRMIWEAGHDPLTGLANRRVITETLQRTADDPADERRHLYFIDLDDFKKVNDAYGHSVGDELLRALASRISMLVEGTDVVGRFGGDELIIVSAQPPEHLAERLLAAIRRPVTFGGTELTVTISVGVAQVGVGEDPGDVVRRSNEAMYAAKRAGKNRYSAAGPLNTGPAQRRVEVEAQLRRAVHGTSGQMHMVFQPIVAADGVPVAAESLLRWEHPTRGTLRPSQFLDIAEAAGLMAELSELIVRQSIAAVSDWTAAGHPLMVTVNADRRELGNGRLPDLIIRALEDSGLPPHQVCLEVTESVLVDADSPELAQLFRLRDIGLEIALDDFGTGYAPLTYLKRLPATILKLDKSFVGSLGLKTPDPVDVAVSRAVRQLAEDLGMRVIAEGVETGAQVRKLTSLGYELFQGFWAHAPMSAQELTALLDRTGSETFDSAGG
jgi:diguanylate cyclase (GGDEF)-like protein